MNTKLFLVYSNMGNFYVVASTWNDAETALQFKFPQKQDLTITQIHVLGTSTYNLIIAL